MTTRPYSKIINLIATFATVVGGLSKEAIISFLTPFFGADFAQPVTLIIIGICGVISLFSHAMNGTGGEDPVIERKFDFDTNKATEKISNSGITKNLTTR